MSVRAYIEIKLFEISTCEAYTCKVLQNRKIINILNNFTDYNRRTVLYCIFLGLKNMSIYLRILLCALYTISELMLNFREKKKPKLFENGTV